MFLRNVGVEWEQRTSAPRRIQFDKSPPRKSANLQAVVCVFAKTPVTLWAKTEPIQVTQDLPSAVHSLHNTLAKTTNSSNSRWNPTQQPRHIIQQLLLLNQCYSTLLYTVHRGLACELFCTKGCSTCPTHPSNNTVSLMMMYFHISPTRGPFYCRGPSTTPIWNGPNVMAFWPQ